MAVSSASHIHDVPLSDALSERYLAYALSTIVDRALPDVRDGLKPVHRRLLYAMLQLKLDPATGFKKCARVVGDVIGKYHPHGDMAVYDALVRLAQDFAVRYPLVEGQGNFGNIDGDGAAAMRYTESRLTAMAMALMEGINEDAVDFRPTYDGEEQEPLIMPAAVPNLLANGSTGIAVGMATNIPPHNLSELCDALLALIKNPQTTLKSLVKLIPGPDFPTGGLLVEDQASILSAYETGRGGFRLRAQWKKEDLPQGQYQIVVTEIPYQVQKSKLIERIADLLQEKKLPLLSDVRDESAEDIRLVLEPKSRTVEPEKLMAHLFSLTDLEIRFSLNMNVLTADGTPQVLSLKDVLLSFIAHRKDVLQRRARFRLDKVTHRLEVLDGYIIVFLNLDQVIKIIRDNDEPKPLLMKKFGLTDIQVEAILNMRLRSLRKLEEMELKKEHKALSTEQKDLKALLASDEKQYEKMADELTQRKEEFGKKTSLGKRRTEIGDAVEEEKFSAESFIEKEPITIVFSEKGWIRSLKGHVDLKESFAFKEGDHLFYAGHAQTTDKLMLFASDGRFFTLACDKLPSGRGLGEPVRLMIDLAHDVDVVALFPYQGNRQLLIASDAGKGFLVDEDSVLAQTKNGKQILNPANSKARFCLPVSATHDYVAIIANNRKLLLFPLSEVPPMARGQGVSLQKYTDHRTRLMDVQVFKLSEGLMWLKHGKECVEKNMRLWVGHRGQVGRTPPDGFPKSNKFS